MINLTQIDMDAIMTSHNQSVTLLYSILNKKEINGVCTLKTKELAELAGVSKSSILRQLDKLSSLGVIKRDHTTINEPIIICHCADNGEFNYTPIPDEAYNKIVSGEYKNNASSLLVIYYILRNLYILSRLNPVKSTLHPKVSTLAKLSNYSHTTVSSYLDALRDLGVIYCTRYSARWPLTYIFVNPQYFDVAARKFKEWKYDYKTEEEGDSQYFIQRLAEQVHY